MSTKLRNESYGNATPFTPELLARLREIASKSTRVVAWYPHGYHDGRMPGCDGTVRGPFGRWFGVCGGDNGMGDPIKYPTPVADSRDDVEFCAAAMNHFEGLLEEVVRLRQDVLDGQTKTTQELLEDRNRVRLQVAEMQRLVDGEAAYRRFLEGQAKADLTRMEELKGEIKEARAAALEEAAQALDQKYAYRDYSNLVRELKGKK